MIKTNDKNKNRQPEYFKGNNKKDTERGFDLYLVQKLFTITTTRQYETRTELSNFLHLLLKTFLQVFPQSCCALQKKFSLSPFRVIFKPFPPLKTNKTHED